jgi:hypothetical protein
MDHKAELQLRVEALAVARRDARLAQLVNPSAIVSPEVPMDPNLSRLAAYLILYPQEQMQRRVLDFWKRNFSQQ